MILHCTAAENYPHAGTIEVDSAPLYAARMLTNKYAFEVLEAGHRLFESQPFSHSRWQEFLGHGEHRLLIPGAEPVAILYSGPFGFRRSVRIRDQIVPFPRRKTFSLLGTEWSREKKTLHVRNVPEELLLPIAGLSYYWLARFLISSSS
jgi:hypothetical protein